MFLTYSHNLHFFGQNLFNPSTALISDIICEWPLGAPHHAFHWLHLPVSVCIARPPMRSHFSKWCKWIHPSWLFPLYPDELPISRLRFGPNMEYLSVRRDMGLFASISRPVSELQGSAKRRSPCLVNFVPALSYHFCLTLPKHSRNLGTTF